ncbi:hypothetical protein BC827DRAFT_1163146 [Russula dissimulans]|nr:hypothetical protein BC827DRAFT_1163146 [Russula dissimulans]
MWEASIDPIDDREKGWAGMWPVALAMPGPISDLKSQPQPQHPTAWRSRLHFPSLGSRVSSNPPQTPHPSESLTPMTSSPPAQLTVLIAMPTHGEARKEKEGPPVVELGVTWVSYAPAPNVP